MRAFGLSHRVALEVPARIYARFNSVSAPLGTRGVDGVWKAVRIR